MSPTTSASPARRASPASSTIGRSAAGPRRCWPGRLCGHRPSDGGARPVAVAPPVGRIRQGAGSRAAAADHGRGHLRADRRRRGDGECAAASVAGRGHGHSVHLAPHARGRGAGRYLLGVSQRPAHRDVSPGQPQPARDHQPDDRAGDRADLPAEAAAGNGDSGSGAGGARSCLEQPAAGDFAWCRRGRDPRPWRTGRAGAAGTAAGAVRRAEGRARQRGGGRQAASHSPDPRRRCPAAILDRPGAGGPQDRGAAAAAAACGTTSASPRSTGCGGACFSTARAEQRLVARGDRAPAHQDSLAVEQLSARCPAAISRRSCWANGWRPTPASCC